MSGEDGSFPLPQGYVDQMKNKQIKDIGASVRARLLDEAILATFRRRLTSLDDRKVIFGEEFKNQKEKRDQWSAFLIRNRMESGEVFSTAMDKIQLFLNPVCDLDAANKDDLVWNPETWKWERSQKMSDTTQRSS